MTLLRHNVDKFSHFTGGVGKVMAEDLSLNLQVLTMDSKIFRIGSVKTLLTRESFLQMVNRPFPQQNLHCQRALGIHPRSI